MPSRLSRFSPRAPSLSCSPEVSLSVQHPNSTLLSPPSGAPNHSPANHNSALQNLANHSPANHSLANHRLTNRSPALQNLASHIPVPMMRQLAQANPHWSLNPDLWVRFHHRRANRQRKDLNVRYKQEALVCNMINSLIHCALFYTVI